MILFKCRCIIFFTLVGLNTQNSLRPSDDEKLQLFLVGVCGIYRITHAIFQRI